MKANLKKHILEMKAYSETHFDNENMFSEKWKVINPFFKYQASWAKKNSKIQKFNLAHFGLKSIKPQHFLLNHSNSC